MGTPYCAGHLDAYPLVGRIQTRCFQPNIAMSPAKRRATVCSVPIHCFPKPWISPIVPPVPFHYSFCSSNLMAKAGTWKKKKKTHKTWDSGQGGKHKATVFNSACKERVISQRLLQKNGWKCVRKRISQRTSNLQNNTWQLISIFHPKVKEFPNVNAYRFPGHYIMSHLFFPSSAGFRPVLLFFLLLLPALSQLETNDSSTWIILFIVSLYKLMFT